MHAGTPRALREGVSRDSRLQPFEGSLGYQLGSHIDNCPPSASQRPPSIIYWPSTNAADCCSVARLLGLSITEIPATCHRGRGLSRTPSQDPQTRLCSRRFHESQTGTHLDARATPQTAPSLSRPNPNLRAARAVGAAEPWHPRFRPVATTPSVCPSLPSFNHHSCITCIEGRSRPRTPPSRYALGTPRYAACLCILAARIPRPSRTLIELKKKRCLATLPCPAWSLLGFAIKCFCCSRVLSMHPRHHHHHHQQQPSLLISCVEMTADLGLLAAGAYPSPPSYPSPQRRKPSVPSLYDRTAMSSLSPNQPSQHSFGGGPSVPDKNSLSTLNLDFLRTMNEKRTTRGSPSPTAEKRGK